MNDDVFINSEWKTLDSDFGYNDIRAGLVKLLLHDRSWDLVEMKNPVEDIKSYLSEYLKYDFRVIDSGIYHNEILNRDFSQFTILIPLADRSITHIKFELEVRDNSKNF